MSLIDYIVLAVYFLAMAAIGVWCMKKVKHQEDLFLGGRTFGKLFQTFAAFGAGTGANDPVNVGRNTYTSGFSGIWSVLFWLLVTPFYWIFAVWYRRMRHLTIGDWFVERYESRALGAAYSVFGIVFYMLYLSVAFTAVSKVCEPLIAPGLADGSLKTILLPIIGLVVVVYGVLGGLRAAYWTDLIQGFFIIVLSVLLIPFGLNLLVENFGDPAREGLMDGFRHLHEQLPASAFQLAGNEFPLYYIACIFLLNLVGIVVQPHFIATGGGSAKSENSARVGLVVGNFLKRFCTVGWALTGLIMLALLSVDPEIGKDPDKVWGLAAVKLLGPLNIGLVGLMVACLLAALMSSADCYMLVTSALVVRNCYAAYLDKDASEERYLLVGRVVGVIIIAGAVFLSLASYDVFGQLKNAWEIPVIFAAPFWIGMFWRRGTKKGAWTTVIFSLIVFVLLPMLLPLVPGLRENQSYAVTTAEVSRTVTRPASPADVARRSLKIQAWRSQEGKEPGALEPKELKVGEEFMETRITAPRSVFWKDGFVRLGGPEKPTVVTTEEDESGARVVTRRYGSETRFRGLGFFNFDFLLYRAIGVDLQGLSREAVEALRLPLKVLVPFLVMIIASLLTRPNSKESLDRFYVKMKTPTEPDPDKDKRELELSYASPDRFDHKKLFPGSSLEIQRPGSIDILGFMLSCLGVVAVILLALWVANLGA